MRRWFFSSVNSDLGKADRKKILRSIIIMIIGIFIAGAGIIFINVFSSTGKKMAIISGAENVSIKKIDGAMVMVGTLENRGEVKAEKVELSVSIAWASENFFDFGEKDFRLSFGDIDIKESLQLSEILTFVPSGSYIIKFDCIAEYSYNPPTEFPKIIPIFMLIVGIVLVIISIIIFSSAIIEGKKAEECAACEPQHDILGNEIVQFNLPKKKDEKANGRLLEPWEQHSLPKKVIKQAPEQEPDPLKLAEESQHSADVEPHEETQTQALSQNPLGESTKKVGPKKFRR